jgi:hypothetical protein
LSKDSLAKKLCRPLCTHPILLVVHYTKYQLDSLKSVQPSSRYISFRLWCVNLLNINFYLWFISSFSLSLLLFSFARISVNGSWISQSKMKLYSGSLVEKRRNSNIWKDLLQFSHFFCTILFLSRTHSSFAFYWTMCTAFEPKRRILFSHLIFRSSDYVSVYEKAEWKEWTISVNYWTIYGRPFGVLYICRIEIKAEKLA